MTMAIERTWEAMALCRVKKLHPNTFDDYGVKVTYAKRVCAMCPALMMCRYANMDEPWGIWGGLNHTEREAWKEGAPVKLCDGCGCTFARKDWSNTLCMACHKNPVTPTMFSAWGELIADLSTNGYTDAQIVRHIADLTGTETIRESHVTLIRRRLNLLPGNARVRASIERGAGEHRGSRKNTHFDEHAVDTAQERGQPAYSTLSTPEKLELMRRWLAAGGTVSTFSRRFGCSGSRANELRIECGAPPSELAVRRATMRAEREGAA